MTAAEKRRFDGTWNRFMAGRKYSLMSRAEKERMRLRRAAGKLPWLSIQEQAAQAADRDAWRREGQRLEREAKARAAENERDPEYQAMMARLRADPTVATAREWREAREARGMARADDAIGRGRADDANREALARHLASLPKK